MMGADQWLGLREELDAGRRDRLHAAEGIVPTPIWVVLFFTAGILLVFMLFFGLQATHSAFDSATREGRSQTQRHSTSFDRLAWQALHTSRHGWQPRGPGFESPWVHNRRSTACEGGGRGNLSRPSGSSM